MSDPERRFTTQAIYYEDLSQVVTLVHPLGVRVNRSDRLERLIAEGEQLVPLGGGDVSTGPNRRLHDDYFAWRSRCVELLTELGPGSEHLLWELKIDTRSYQFYQASASRVLGVMKAARLLKS